MNILRMFRRSPDPETLKRKAAVDRAYERFMREIFDYWRDIFTPEYQMQPLKIENKAKT